MAPRPLPYLSGDSTRIEAIVATTPCGRPLRCTGQSWFAEIRGDHDGERPSSPSLSRTQEKGVSRRNIRPASNQTDVAPIGKAQGRSPTCPGDSTRIEAIVAPTPCGRPLRCTGNRGSRKSGEITPANGPHPLPFGPVRRRRGPPGGTFARHPTKSTSNRAERAQGRSPTYPGRDCSPTCNWLEPGSRCSAVRPRAASTTTDR